MAIIVFQHHDIGRPGRLGATLRDHGFDLEILRPDRGDPPPPDLDNVDGVISLGGPQNVDDPPEKAPWMADEIAFLKEAHERRLPVLGVCLGAQLIASALGGRVEPMEQPEVGFHEVSIEPPGQTDTVFAGLAWRSCQFCHHTRHIAEPPNGAGKLASSKRCDVQAFRAGMRTYGVQYHFEVDRDMAMALTRSSKDDLHRAGYTEDEITSQLDEHYDRFARLADRLCVNIATTLMPAGRRRVA